MYIVYMSRTLPLWGTFSSSFNSHSMASAMSERNEKDLKWIDVKNRPMNVMDDFTTFCSQQWLDAKFAIDDWTEEHHREIDDEVSSNLLLDGIYVSELKVAYLCFIRDFQKVKPI